MPSATLNTQTSILQRTIGRSASDLSPETARFFLSLQLTPGDEERANELAAKSRAGTLSPDEHSEIDEYRRVGRVIEMLKIRAQVILKSVE